jgi:hypothetical protein
MAADRDNRYSNAATSASRIDAVLATTRSEYYKLILGVGAARSGKTATLSELSNRNNWPRINVNLQVAEKLLELTRKQRAVRVAGILDEIVRAQSSAVVLLDNIELLFAEDLAQDPLRLLQSLSRNRTIVAAWPGAFDGSYLTYAEPGHPEARRYPAPQAVIVKIGPDEHLPAGSPPEGC